MRVQKLLLVTTLILAASAAAQETPPAPSAPKAVSIPAVKETKLGNGFTVAVIEKTSVPLVTMNLLVKAGASSEDMSKAGLADITAAMLTKGTKTRSATEIAEAIEFLGGSINSGAGWNNSFVSVTVTSDKAEQAKAILAEVISDPLFDQKELDLLKSQMLDGLTFNLKQPSFLAGYVASKASFNEHPAGGTPASIASITVEDVRRFYQSNYKAEDSVLIFAGDVSFAKAVEMAKKSFTGFGSGRRSAANIKQAAPVDPSKPFRRIVVVDLPNAGQASVGYYKSNPGLGRTHAYYYPATVLNSVLGGGYSSRLNMEIRIKRGLSYGAGSGFAWRGSSANFSTRAQTKNESAAEVAELVLAEIDNLKKASVGADEMTPRKSVLTGGFGRSLETTAGLAAAVGDLYTFGVSTTEMNAYVGKVNGVTDDQIRSFASSSLGGGDLIIVGDHAKFKADLEKRFPGAEISVIKADALDLSKDNLQK